jgi:hypothetical protein
MHIRIVSLLCGALSGCVDESLRRRPTRKTELGVRCGKDSQCGNHCYLIIFEFELKTCNEILKNDSGCP